MIFNLICSIPILDPRLQPPREGLLEIMRENAKKLGEIRKICNKIAIIRNMGQQPPGVSASWSKSDC